MKTEMLQLTSQKCKISIEIIINEYTVTNLMTQKKWTNFLDTYALPRFNHEEIE